MKALSPYTAVCLAGPTATGKSQLALRLAETHPITVINTDSLQVYQDLPRLTARPLEKDYPSCPHVLYGFLPAVARFSVAAWLEKAKEAYFNALDQKRRPVFVGGTGLYFKALLEGLSQVPPVPDNILATVNTLSHEKGAKGLYDRLKELAPFEAARLRPTDPARLSRSLSVLLSTGKPLSWWHQQPSSPPFLKEKPLIVTLLPERHTLYNHANTRLENMLKEGALEEIKALLTLQEGRSSAEKFALLSALPVSKALGAKPLAQAVLGLLSLDNALAQAQQDTRRYIKRQYTWFRHQLPDAFVFERESPELIYQGLKKLLNL